VDDVVPWVFGCRALVGRMALLFLLRGVLGEIAERTASLGYISVIRPSSAREIRRERGSWPPKVIMF